MSLRGLILWMAAQKSLRRFVETSPAARRFSSRFVAGQTLADALAVCAKLRSEGIAATLDYLGENVKTEQEAAACREMYLRALEALGSAGLEPNVSIKLTQFGLDLSEALCAENVAALVGAAAGMNGFVRIDMESSAYTDRTLEMVRGMHRRFSACGVVIQSYLRRSAADAERLVSERIRVRLCKGAYLEPPEVAFPAKADVDRNYLALARKLLVEGNDPAVATHDERIVEAVKMFVAERKIDRGSFEFQMLYGIRRDLQRGLVAEGYRLRLYVPFGEAWYPYFMRRLAERPANTLFFARNLLKG